ncbi:MAG TPA: hypothetical protein VF290_23455 [Pyrinomonadaceae bacterium]
MKQLTKLLLGLLTLWPFAYVILFFVVILAEFFMAGSGQPGPPPLIALIFPLHILTMLLIMALLVFYIVNVFRNNRVENDKKVLWAVVLFMGGMIAMPIYWYMYIWKEAPVFSNRSPEQLVGGDSASSIRDEYVGSREKEYVPREPPDWR